MKTLKERTEYFLERAVGSLRPDDNLDFSKVEYVNDRTPVTIVDRDLRPDGTPYGEFRVTPSNFLKGRRHPDRKGERVSKRKQSPWDDIIRRFREVHEGENLDYSQVVYRGMHAKVKIISHDLRPDGTEYGEFWQEPAVHLRGASHPDIARDRRAERNRITTCEFVARLCRIFGDRPYDYSLTRYISRKGKATVICRAVGGDGREHGPFTASVESLYSGKGCPKCSRMSSTAEDWLYGLLTDAVGASNVVTHARGVIEGCELDFLMPRHGLAVEYNGLKWHTEEYGRDIMYHLGKTKECLSRGIRLIQVFEDEYVRHRELVEARILHCLGQGYDYRMAISDCDVRGICGSEAEAFLDEYHMRGCGAATRHYGAFWHGSLVGVQSYAQREGNGRIWGIVRSVAHPRWLVEGLYGGLLAAFLSENGADEVWATLDCRWDGLEEDAELRSVGFTLNDYIPPMSRYTDGHRERLTLEEARGRNGAYFRIWDCGMMRYVLRRDGHK